MSLVMHAETVEVRTCLGIRFWDSAFDEPVRNGLEVLGHFPGRSPRTRRATRTASGIYAFFDLPRSATDDVSNPPESAREQVEVQVVDRRGRYVSCSFEVTVPLPYGGPYPQNPSSSGPQPRGLLLSSAYARTAPTWMMNVRGELAAAAEAKPAAHALVLLESAGGQQYSAVADALGRFSLLAPYPPLPRSVTSSTSGLLPGQGLEQDWEMTLKVHYEPRALSVLPHSGLPALRTVLAQAPATVLIDSTSSGHASELPISVRFGRSTLVKTQSRSQLLVRAA